MFGATTGYFVHIAGSGNTEAYVVGAAGLTSGLYKINTFSEGLGAVVGYLATAAQDIFTGTPEYGFALVKAGIFGGGVLLGTIIPSKSLHDEYIYRL